MNCPNCGALVKDNKQNVCEVCGQVLVDTEDKPLLKGWQTFIDGVKGGFDKFKTSLEDQSTKNKEFLEENTDKVNKFFKTIKNDWDKQIQKWSKDIEQRNLESKEQWEVRKSKIQKDIKNWQEKTQKDWDDGVKSFRRGFFKAYFWIILLTLPIILIIVVVLFVINKLLG
ncbi:MAG: hypothetical protein ACFFCV_17090 [Promethearchaeota archaeon]